MGVTFSVIFLHSISVDETILDTFTTSKLLQETHDFHNYIDLYLLRLADKAPVKKYRLSKLLFEDELEFDSSLNRLSSQNLIKKDVSSSDFLWESSRKKSYDYVKTDYIMCIELLLKKISCLLILYTMDYGF